nr:protein MAIN-LIKE 1-like [Setaria viridis]XP_034601057.1 protein MAIN-LIKE 1-like [Setaria viridis]
MVILQNARQPKISEGKLPDPIKPRQSTSLEHMVKHRHEYDEYLAKANLLDFSNLLNKGLPALDHGLLSALVDRWSPITNTFHFPFGEMTPTLQDVAMMFALPINGKAVIGDIRRASINVQEILGVALPTKLKEGREEQATQVTQGWLMNNFNSLPTNASPAVIQSHTRAYALSILGGFIFSNKSSGTVHFDILPLLADWDTAGQYSWGSAVLAFLYRELRMASCNAGLFKKVGVGGCLSFLQLWFWIRVPLGRPQLPFFSVHNQSKLSVWLDLKCFKTRKRSHLEYTLSIDSVDFLKVQWQPYGRMGTPEIRRNLAFAFGTRMYGEQIRS